MNRRYNRRNSRLDQPDPYDGSYDLTNPQSFNRYAYTQNDPVNYVDPTGLHWELTNCHAHVAKNPEGFLYFDGSEDCELTWINDGPYGGGGAGGGGGGGGKDPTPAPKGDPNNKCDSSVYGAEMNRKMTPIAKSVGGRLGKDPLGNFNGTISGLEKVQTQYVVKRFESAGFSQFYSYNHTVHPGMNLERPESNDTVWYHITLEPGKTPSMSVPPARITIHCDNAENHSLHHIVQDYLRWGWPF